MVLPLYWLDSNAYIEAKKRYYAFDIVPAYWELIESRASAGSVKSPRRVYDEITGQLAPQDELAEWARARRELIFTDPSPPVQTAFAEIAAWVSGTYTSDKSGAFLGCADPWVIAHARVEGIVVTLESREGDPNWKNMKVKIPNVCEQFAVEWITPYELVRRLGARFALSMDQSTGGAGDDDQLRFGI